MQVFNKSEFHGLRFIISSSNEFFDTLSPERQKEYFQSSMKYLETLFGKKNTIYAVVHNDEHTPHMHFGFVPMTGDNRVCAKEVINRNILRQIQEELPKHLQKAGFDIERGEVNSEAVFRSRDHKEMLSRLEYLKTVRGIGIFTARPGMGKTYALRCFMKGLNPNQYQTAYISLSTISVTEFYREFCTLLGLEASGNKTGMFRAIQERVYYLYREKKQPLVLAIDEAQYLNYNILRDLKMLLNHSYDSLNCFSLVLVGEPYLNHILDKQVHEALRQRITVHYNYEGLSDQEVPDYICHKLERY